MYARQALVNAKKPAASGLKPGAQEFPALLANNSFRNPPPYEKPVGNLAGACSCRIDIQHRSVHEVFTKEDLPLPACIARLRTQALSGTRLHFLESPMSISFRPASNLILKWLLLLCAMLGGQCSWAEDKWLQLALPGEELNQSDRAKKTRLSTWVAEQRWYALSVKDGVLAVEPVTATTEPDLISVTGKNADRLLAGKPLARPAKPTGISLKAPVDALLLARIQLDSGGAQHLTPGRFQSYVAPDVMREGWLASADVDGQKWKFYTRHEKRPDGKLLAGSLEILADREMPRGASTVLLPPASGMAFTKQELLWLGDMNGDGQPDLLLKRTWVTGEIDFVLAITPMFASAYLDPDQPASYFSSGVEPESNLFVWNKRQPKPAAINFISKGSFSIGEENWRKLLDPSAPPPYQDEPAAPQGKLPPLQEAPSSSGDLLLLPITLTDRLFKLNGESIRFTLEHLPRANNQSRSSASNGIWGGSVLVKASFRGKSQVLMQAETPDSGSFGLSVGLIDGEPSIRIDHQPHYNNSFSQYWIYDKAGSRFRRLRIEHSQGC